MNEKNYSLNFLKLFWKPSYIPLIAGMFAILTTIQFLGQTRNVEIELAEEKWIMVGIFLAIVEVFNQIAYCFTKKYPKLPAIKGIILSLTFFVLTGFYLYRIIQFPMVRDYNNTSANISELFVNLLISFFLPFYNFTSGVRFWLLYGKFSRKSCGG